MGKKAKPRLRRPLDPKTTPTSPVQLNQKPIRTCGSSSSSHSKNCRVRKWPSLCFSLLSHHLQSSKIVRWVVEFISKVHLLCTIQSSYLGFVLQKRLFRGVVLGLLQLLPTLLTIFLSSSDKKTLKMDVSSYLNPCLILYVCIIVCLYVCKVCIFCVLGFFLG